MPALKKNQMDKIENNSALSRVIFECVCACRCVCACFAYVCVFVCVCMGVCVGVCDIYAGS